MTEEGIVQTKFHAFLQQRKNKANFAMQEGQKLVNLYRTLNVFGTGFVDEYNTMLLNAPDEVLMTLNAIVGGKEVRQYVDFLRMEMRKEMPAEEASSSNQNAGWLPSPEDEAAQNHGNGNYISGEEWNSFVKAEEEKIKELIGTLREEQNDTLKKLADQWASSLEAKSSFMQNKGAAPTATQYSEIIEDQHKERP